MDGVMKLLRAKVSADKHRYQEGGYDLDLSTYSEIITSFFSSLADSSFFAGYITDRIIGMAFPSEGLEKAYRNNIDDVSRLLEEKHPNHYMLYNLAAPRCYEYKKFKNKVGLKSMCLPID